MDKIKEIIVMVAPLAAGFITSVVLPFLIKRITLKRLENKISQINEAEEIKEINRKLECIARNLDEMRGKRR